MHDRLLKARAGFTLAETLVAMVLTAVVGVAVTSLFVTQSRFYDRQEKVSFARSGARGSMNLMMSEMRMLEQTGAVAATPAPTLKAVTIRVPYRMGVVCSGSVAGVIAAALPVDNSVTDEGGHSGFAWRSAAGAYSYLEGGTVTVGTTAQEAACDLQSISFADGSGSTIFLSGNASAAPVAQPVLLYKLVTYEFKASELMPGRIALWRTLETTDEDEEIAGPFDDSAGFRFYTGTPPVLNAGVPAPANITGFRIDLNAVSERPETDGTYVVTPLSTSVYFRNQ